MITCDKVKGKVTQDRRSFNTHSLAFLRTVCNQILSPWSLKLLLKESGKRRKETNGLTGSPGILTAFGTVCNSPDEGGTLFITTVPYVEV